MSRQTDSKPFLIGCGAGFSGDRVDAPGPVVQHLAGTGYPSVLMLETLGERTLALAQKARMADPGLGYEPLLDQIVGPVLDTCLASGIPIVGNFGAANPDGAAERIFELAKAAGLRRPRIAVVTGDDLRDRLADLTLSPWEGDASDDLLIEQVVAANAYLGALPIADALSAGADIVVTGRVADPALALGPLINHFDWSPTDWDRLAAGTMAGHLLECGAQITGGYFADPGMKDVPAMDRIGFPIAEVTREADVTITKASGTGGVVDQRTAKEQLLYEVHDPAAYITPDVVADLTEAELADRGPDRVGLSGIKGHPATEQLKVTVSLTGGWLGEGEISYAGPNAEARARLAADTLIARLNGRGLDVRRRVDLIGVASILDDDRATLRSAMAPGAEDVRVRLAVEGPDRAAVEAATQEVLALLCCGPAGGGGARRNHVSRINTRSYLVPKAEVTPEVRFA